MMEWENQQQQQQQQDRNEILQIQMQQLSNGDGINNGLYVKVMTDEQMEILRQQISVYSSICEQLVEMHKTITAQQDLAGMRLGNLYCDPIMASVGHKITSRQRWTPTPLQLQILEQIFDEGNGTPSKQKIKDITMQLTQHGQISESNVYNWFQNRRARSKRKQPNSSTNNADSEAETEVDSPKDKKTRPENFETYEQLVPSSNSLYPEKPDSGAEMLSFDAHSNKEEPVFQSFRSDHISQMTTTPDLRIHLSNDKLNVPGGYTSYHPSEGYHLVQ